MHPSRLNPEEFWKQCQMETTRRGGPGGQHRNKVESAVVLRHEPTGIQAEANERRSQADNRKVAIERLRLRIALEHRGESDSDYPSDLWLSRLKNNRLLISADHEDYPALIAEALDVLSVHKMDQPASAGILHTTSSQLTKLFRQHPQAWQTLNVLRVQQGLSPLKST
jgi:hypothetical protein